MENKSYSESISKWEWLKGKKVFVACSGGVDSVFLIHMLLDLHVNVEVLHVNYQLRGEESYLDQQFVADLCSKLGLRFHLNTINSKKILAEKKENLQQFARDQRYQWFQEIQVQFPESFIALGHHSDDQIETFFLQLARKSGVMGLSGMLPKNGIYIRPLLNFSKQEIYATAKEKKLCWREDSSNQTLKYSRNKLRNHILPSIYSEVPDLKESILFIMKKIQSSQLTIEERVQGIALKIKETKKWFFSELDVFGPEELIEILRNLKIGGNQLPELYKLRKAQKGAKRAISQMEFIREADHFRILEQELATSFFLSITTIHSLPTIFDKSVVYFDPSKIDGELYLRPWRNGDRMKKIGMKGTSLISDLLTDAKIPHSMRGNWPVVCDSSGILWCYKFAISENALAKSDAHEIWKLELIEMKL